MCVTIAECVFLNFKCSACYFCFVFFFRSMYISKVAKHPSNMSEYLLMEQVFSFSSIYL